MTESLLELDFEIVYGVKKLDDITMQAPQL